MLTDDPHDGGDADGPTTFALPGLHQLWHVPAWTIDALCAQVDPEAWFPEKGGSTAEAKAVCRRCPVQFECLEYALTNSERFGIWGGTSERDRRLLAKPTTPPAPPTIPCGLPGCSRLFATAAWASRHRKDCTATTTQETA